MDGTSLVNLGCHKSRISCNSPVANSPHLNTAPSHGGAYFNNIFKMPPVDWKKIVSDSVDSGELDQHYSQEKPAVNHLDAFRERVKRNIEGEGDILSSVGIPEPPVERNIVGETAAALGRGVGKATEYTGRGIEELGGESVGGALRSAGESIQQAEFLAPSEELKTGQAGLARRTLAGAAESIPMSVVPLATAAAGAAVGAATTVNPVGAAIGGLAGGAAGLGTVFYGGTYSAEKERALKDFEQLHPDWTPEQREQEASSFAHKQALWETGTEGVSDLVTAGIGRALANGIVKEGVTGAKAVLRDLLGSGGPKEMAKKFAQVYAAEGGSEIAAYLGQAANEQAYGLGDGPTLTGALDTAVTSLWMTGALGAAGAGMNYSERNKTVSGLNSENKLIRDKAAEKVEVKVAEKFGPESAKQWRSIFESSAAEGKGGGFSIDSPLFGAAAEAYAPEGGGVLEKALGATQPASTRPDANAQFEAASRAADEAAMEANPEYEAASALAGEAASEVNSEAQFETESVATRKRAAGIPLDAAEEAALAAAEQRLARPAPVATPPVSPAQNAMQPVQQAGGVATETPEQAQRGYEEYQPVPPVNPASEYGQQQAEFDRIQKEAVEYNRLKNIPDKLPELPEDLRNADSLSRPQLLAVAKKYNIPTVNDTGKAVGVKAAVKRFAVSEQKRIASETRLRTPDEQARLDQLTGRTPERLAARAARERSAAEQRRFRQAAAEIDNAPLKPAPGAEMRLIRDIEQARPDRAAAVHGIVRPPARSAIESAIAFEIGEPTERQVAAEETFAQRRAAADRVAKRAAVEQELASVFSEDGLASAQKIADEKRFIAREGEDVAAALPVMMRELTQGTAGRRLRNAGESYGYDADAGAMIGEPSSYPKWVQENAELSKAGRAAIERVAELARTGGKMTERQIDLWSRLKAAAQKEYGRNPEIQQGVGFDRLTADGYNFETAEGGLLASDLSEGDSVALLEDGAIVRYTSQGVDESTGRVVLEKDGGGIKELGGFDPVEPVAVKLNRSEVPFSKAQAPLENAADVRAELAKEYSAGWIDRAERRGLFKFVDPAAAERLVVEMGIDPKRAANGRIEGFVSPDGQIHLVHGGIEAGRSLGVAAHELGSHVMRSGFVKEQAWQDVLGQSDRLLAKGDKSVAEARRRAVEAETPASLLREETVAYLSNIAPRHGIIRSLIAKLKQFMINNNLASKFFISKLTASDLQALAQGATKAAIKGKAAPGWAKGVDARLSYAGEKAKTADIKRLDEARAMQAAGVDNEEIRQKTGWFQGVDKKWRFEIDDSKIKVKDVDIKNIYSISDAIESDELFNAYPFLKEIPLNIDRGGEMSPMATAQYEGPDRGIRMTNSVLSVSEKAKDRLKEIEKTKQYKDTFEIPDEVANSLSDEDVDNMLISWKYSPLGIEEERLRTSARSINNEHFKDVIVHELQHAIQKEENFASGAPPEYLDKYGLLRKGETPDEGYNRVAGEVESRDVSARRNMTSGDRRTAKPYVSQGVSEKDMIIIDSNKSMSSPLIKITTDLRVEATNKKGEPITRPLTKKALAEQKPLTPVKEAVETRTEELRSGLTEGDMLARKIEQEAQKKVSPRKQAQVEKDLLEQIRVFKKQHLQPEIQDMANEIFGTIDPEARRMTPAKEANLKATRAEIERLKAAGADIDPALEAKVARLDRRRIGDMLPGEAQALLDVANELAYVNKIKNKLLAVEHGQDAAELSKGIIAPIEAKPSRRYTEAKKTGQKTERGKNPILDLGRQLLGDPASTFKTLMLDLGRANEKSSAVKLAQTVTERQNIELKHRKELDEQLSKSIGNWQALAESKEWSAEQDVNGRKLTSGEKVYLKYSLNDQNVSDSIEKMGYRKKLDTKATKMSRAEREAIKLNPEEQKVYDALSEYFESTYQVLNPAHVEMKGWTLPAAGRGKYLPKSVSSLTLADELGSIIRSGSVENTGVVQDRIGTLNEINLKDIFEVITRQRDIASKYAAYAPMVRDFNLVFRSPELKNTLQMEYGLEKNGKSIVENYVDDLLRDLQGNKPQSDSGVEAAVRKIRTNTAGALLAFRLTTPLMQMTGYPRALAHISPQNLAKALRMRDGFEEAVKWNMRAYARWDVGIDREIADNRNRRLIRAGMAGIQKMDELVTGRLWSATKLQTAQETGLRGDELLAETSKRFNAVLDTQGGHTMADLSMTSRTQSELAKMFTIFSSDKFAMLNELKRGLIIREHTGDWKPLARASAGMVLSAAMAAGVATVVGGAVSGKDKDYEEEFAKNLAGSLPLFDQLVSMFQGFNPSSAGIEAIGDAANAAGRIASLARKQASGETVTAEQYSKALQSVVNSASLAAGVPAKNITDNLGFTKRLALGKDALEQVESELRGLEDFDFEKRKAKITKGKQGAELRAAATFS
jgi:hypothetical protein